jgi:hypothetical protein
MKKGISFQPQRRFCYYHTIPAENGQGAFLCFGRWTPAITGNPIRILKMIPFSPSFCP